MSKSTLIKRLQTDLGRLMRENVEMRKQLAAGGAKRLFVLPEGQAIQAERAALQAELDAFDLAIEEAKEDLNDALTRLEEVMARIIGREKRKEQEYIAQLGNRATLGCRKAQAEIAAAAARHEARKAKLVPVQPEPAEPTGATIPAGAHSAATTVLHDLPSALAGGKPYPVLRGALDAEDLLDEPPTHDLGEAGA